MNCEDCDYSDIADWDQDKTTGKAIPVYWCERYKKMCSSISECQYETEDICDIHDYCYDLIKENAELKGNEYSVQRSREYAIKHLKESIEIMTDLLKDLEGGEKG